MLYALAKHDFLMNKRLVRHKKASKYKYLLAMETIFESIVTDRLSERLKLHHHVCNKLRLLDS